VQRFLTAIDRSGCIYTHRWNDLVIQAAAVQIFMPREKVYKFIDWTYEHSSCDYRHPNRLGWGGLFLGTLPGPDAKRLLLEHIQRYGQGIANELTW
jgi:alpha 1,2-mannosyltransferase